MQRLEVKVSPSVSHIWCTPRFPPLFPGARKIRLSEINRSLFLDEIRDILLICCCLSVNEPQVWEYKMQYNRTGNSTKSTSPGLLSSNLHSCSEKVRNTRFLVTQNSAQVICNSWEGNHTKQFRPNEAVTHLTPGWGCKAHLFLSYFYYLLLDGTAKSLLSITCKRSRVDLNFKKKNHSNIHNILILRAMIPNWTNDVNSNSLHCSTYKTSHFCYPRESQNP